MTGWDISKNKTIISSWRKCKMLKVPRFMKEYSLFKRESNELVADIDNQIKTVNQVDKALKAYSQGLITVDEAMQLIREA